MQATQKYNRWLFIISALLVMVVAASLFFNKDRVPNIPYTRLETLIDQGRVAEVQVRGHELTGKFSQPQDIGPGKEKSTAFRSRVPEFGSTGILDRLQAHDVPVRVLDNPQGGWDWLYMLLPWLLIIGVWVWMSRRAAGMYGGGLGQLTQSKLKRAQPEASQTRFDDVAGQESVKRDVTELVEFLKNPARYEEIGAEMPHGILLYGPPGTGKTLMARALAGEAGVPFFHVSGSEFIEMVVGIGASRVRQTFEEAKKHQPSILFIDEIDAIGRQRGAGMGGGHDEREQTLNQILNEMDGFTEKQAVVVVAATNRPDVLDPALLRPGRFDRRVALELPDRKAREAILRIHSRNVRLAEDVDLGVIAASTQGFSGADLRNLVNEAAILAARGSISHVSNRHLDEARDKVVLGASRPLSIAPEERRRLAVHESGHTAAAYFLPRADPPHKVTIIPHGQALGGTQQLPEAEQYVADEDYLRDRLAVTLAGRASEQVFLGNVSSGADDDIRTATRLARAMISRWGMSSRIGPVDLRTSDDHPFLGLDVTHQREFSERTAYQVDQEVKKLLSEATDRATRLIGEHRARIERLIDDLEEHETLEAEQIGACLATAGDDTGRHDTGKRAADA
ncbi:MAG TPA: ATP-dependent zinc metalloprotease FtsH [Alphaproteobacteria bacterium]|nr:ATP-dependent zinc metalloprotease FtsH [Alphaproteobacteria bacterium]